MTNALVFLDTETTGLHHDRRPWEIALIRREPSGRTTEQRVFVADVDLSSAELIGLNVGHFYDSHPSFRAVDPIALSDGVEERKLSPGTWLATEAKAAVLVERMTRGATIIGAVPNFDTECLAAMLRRHNLCAAWHYHLIDVEAVALGYLHAASPYPSQLLDLPIKSDALSELCGVQPPSEEERHTAIGDARWVQRWYDTLTDGSIPEA
ncbi:hypothetical protein CH249_14190 [Rhodococcus sp. 05-2255-3B1]|uniref:hypothetical protein n=1 Tax=unclassified Rhodococcus (in: high G+C Gram-positive bacteria) TaxID=192944 RepID=UPI000B9A31E7|nr:MULTISPECIES: hypothetical protein [unclassified Rhodococcus (in: high G+C Gram-positive bacteria)]OZE10226.1 hypothetical protein CH249_14190 [Rhodococcus sp. 05-2255-3B1]OZE13604.1 hypothetical protein CH250_06945 [Rhodococcus sp. 05-2255-3C]OZE13691.1 hypothetical protein CH255_23750 [Rhodococcus sp. 05-2255-2A2]